MRVSNLLFSASMVKAIIREIERPGTGKTQTRRGLTRVRAFPILEGSSFTISGDDLKRTLQVVTRFRHIDHAPGVHGWVWDGDGFEWHMPPDGNGWMADIGYSVGDLIYVREAWRVGKRWDGTAPHDLPPRTMTVFFEAGGSISGVAECPKDRPRPAAEYVPDLRYPPSRPDWVGQVRQSMFMPRWASRLTLEVTDVRVERLQEISEADAIAEGAYPIALGLETDGPYRCWFHQLWDSINGDRPGLAWKYNPWVVAISFRPHLINIDAFLETRADALKEIGG